MSWGWLGVLYPAQEGRIAFVTGLPLLVLAYIFLNVFEQRAIVFSVNNDELPLRPSRGYSPAK